MDSEEELQAMRESLLKSLGTLASDPADDLTPVETRWVAAFRKRADFDEMLRKHGQAVVGVLRRSGIKI